jgi:MerR family copper efflux transcriptional regulator
VTHPARLMQIGEVSDRIGLSLPTIRHYDQAGLVVPSARSQGGFRLYTEEDVDKLRVIKRMKPLGFSLEEMRELLDSLQALEHPETVADLELEAGLVARLGEFEEAAQSRCRQLREQLAMAEEYAAGIRSRLERARSVTPAG